MKYGKLSAGIFFIILIMAGTGTWLYNGNKLQGSVTDARSSLAQRYPVLPGALNQQLPPATLPTRVQNITNQNTSSATNPQCITTSNSLPIGTTNILLTSSGVTATGQNNQPLALGYVIVSGGASNCLPIPQRIITLRIQPSLSLRFGNVSLSNQRTNQPSVTIRTPNQWTVEISGLPTTLTPDYSRVIYLSVETVDPRNGIVITSSSGEIRL